MREVLLLVPTFLACMKVEEQFSSAPVKKVQLAAVLAGLW